MFFQGHSLSFCDNLQLFQQNKCPPLSSANDHLVKKFSLLRKILHQFILRHPDKILTLCNVELVFSNYLRLKEEPLAEDFSKEKE